MLLTTTTGDEGEGTNDFKRSEETSSECSNDLTANEKAITKPISKTNVI